ncbi:MAG: hypothetical protein QM736_21255 [Vicinamibacterales bacterium]
MQPDLVILCVRMDDADGLTVLSMLKLESRYPRHPRGHLHERAGRRRARGAGRRRGRGGLFTTPASPMQMN